MNKEQKINFLKRLSQGKASLNELTFVDPFDTSIPELVWEETMHNVYTNVSGEYFDKNGIEPRTLSLTFTEFEDFNNRAGRYRCLIFGKPYRPGEVDPHEDDKKHWITFS